MDVSIFEEKSSFKLLGLIFPSKLDWAPTLSQLLKLSPRKLEPWFVLWSFLLQRLLFISINVPYSHVVMSGLVLLATTWNCWISCKNGYVGLLVLHSLPLDCLARRWNVASLLSLFYRYYFGRCSSELAQLVRLPYSWASSTQFSDRLHDFSVTILRCWMSMSTVS